MSSATEVAGCQQYLAFTLAGADYAVPILKVREIIQYGEITPVPSTPPSVRGVLNLRGNVVPVVDLAVKFGVSGSPIGKRTCVLVIETVLDGVLTVMGLVADAVSEVMELGPDDIEEPPSFGARVHVTHLLGLGAAGKRFVLLLDIEKALSADERELADVALAGERMAERAAGTLAPGEAGPP